MADTEDNPSLRQRFGKRVAERIKKQRSEERQQTAFKAATKRFRPRKAELGKIVLLAATKTRDAKPGDRVGADYKGKVYALYVTKNKTVKPYRERVYTEGKRRRAKSKHPVPYKTHTLDPQQFPTKASRKQAFELFVTRGDRLVAPLVVIAKKGNVSWHETVVPLAVEQMKELVQKATGGKGVGNLPMMVDVDVTLQLPDGSSKTIRVSDDFGQRKEQGTQEKDFYTPFFQKKIYALLGESLVQLGLVSQGSAKMVARYNRGVPVSQWQWRGGLWKKRDLYEAGQVARISEVRVQPFLKRVGKRPKK